MSEVRLYEELRNTLQRRQCGLLHPELEMKAE